MNDEQASPDMTLQQIWLRFDKLARLREDTLGLAGGDEEAEPWSMPAEKLDVLIEPIDSAMSKLAWLVADVESKDQHDLRLKTRILIECVADKEAALIVAVATSLLSDARRLLD